MHLSILLLAHFDETVYGYSPPGPSSSFCYELYALVRSRGAESQIRPHSIQNRGAFLIVRTNFNGQVHQIISHAQQQV